MASDLHNGDRRSYQTLIAFPLKSNIVFIPCMLTEETPKDDHFCCYGSFLQLFCSVVLCSFQVAKLVQYFSSTLWHIDISLHENFLSPLRHACISYRLQKWLLVCKFLNRGYGNTRCVFCIFFLFIGITSPWALQILCCYHINLTVQWSIFCHSSLQFRVKTSVQFELLCSSEIMLCIRMFMLLPVERGMLLPIQSYNTHELHPMIQVTYGIKILGYERQISFG